ncbi:MAG: radical SAM protein [Myxococcales bacterium]|nr:radical SAM protein [Myxococcales bacterium]
MSQTRVLLLWPGCEGAAAGNFGVPQLVLLGTYARAKTGARVDIVDLAAERALGPVSLDALLAGPDGRGYDVIALSVYASFDHLKCTAIAEIARRRWPDAVIVAGGYHPSARPLDYIAPDSPFDVCVIGEGERPLVTIIESVEGGAPLRKVALGPSAIDHLDELPPSDWSLLGRYRGVARRVASQAQVYLSRGCPFDCAFCMERAKREVSWRSLSVERALEEIASLHRFLDLRSWTLYFGDALFGMRRAWRREFLEGLACLGVPVDKYWLLIRVDLVEEEDLRLFSAANCGLGFGLESGDPGLLAIIRKSGRLDTYLERMLEISQKAREHDVPWGANVICGHPGETPATMERSAAYLRRLFGDPRGTTGFLSVDPFRLYPGSPIDGDRGFYEREFGTRFHYPEWWDDGDPEFLSEWIDPSSELDYRRREALQDSLMTPILASIEDNFVYRGAARAYFQRAIRGQLAFTRAGPRIHYLDRYYAWQGYLGRREQGERERLGDSELAKLARELRRERLAAVQSRAQVRRDAPVMAAIEAVPRERFVLLDQVAQSVDDVALPLDDSGDATISAMHAYARSFSLLEVGPGDRVLDLGAGSGYGAAILRALVGDDGDVAAIEVDPALVARARRALAGQAVTLAVGDALDPATWPPSAAAASKVSVGFALEELPASWLEVLAPGTVIVAPLRHAGVLRLVRAIHDGEAFACELFEEVAYVRARRPAPREPQSAPPAERARLPIVG